jgi:hypothetical protein
VPDIVNQRLAGMPPFEHSPQHGIIWRKWIKQLRKIRMIYGYFIQCDSPDPEANDQTNTQVNSTLLFLCRSILNIFTNPDYPVVHHPHDNGIDIQPNQNPKGLDF